MVFRDDRDALAERVQVLETELVEVQRARREAERVAARVPALEKELQRSERELTERRIGDGPRLRRLRIVFAVTLGALAAGLALLFWLNDSRVQRERAGLLRIVAENETRGRHLEARARELEGELRGAQAQVADLEERLATERVAPEPPPPAPAVFLPSARSRVQIVSVARVAGMTSVRRGDPCTLVLDVDQGECRARVRCGEVGLYPDPGSGGYFPCEVDDEGPVHGADVRRTELSGDPRFDYDRARHRATVSDGSGAGAWEVELRLP